MNIGFKMSKSSRFIRNRVLSLGNPICCPSVTFAMDKCEGFQFSHDFKILLTGTHGQGLQEKRAGSYISVNLL